MSVPGYLSPVRIVFRKTMVNPDDVNPLGSPDGLLGHIFVRWLPAEGIGRVSLWAKMEKEPSAISDFPSAAEAGEYTLYLIEKAIAGYKAEQEDSIAAQLVSMNSIDMPDLQVPVRKGFRPVTARAAHAEFVRRVQREAEAFRTVIAAGLQQLVVAGWITPQLVELPHFTIPEPSWPAKKPTKVRPHA
jgi:hypothetical protein